MSQNREALRLIFPIENYKNILSRFRDRNVYEGKDWGMHLGVDLSAPAETKVFSIGKGAVVYSNLHPAEISPEGKVSKKNWGGIVIIGHRNPKTKKVFYSIYGHLGKRFVKPGDLVEMGELIGEIGKATSESNGGWETEHIHFGIYHGPFHEKVLPGYYKEGEETSEPRYWKDPIRFIKSYNTRISKLALSN